MAELSKTARSLITLLNNIDDLIVISQKRSVARDVMSALQIFAKNENYPLPHQKITHFYSTLIDSRPLAISSLLKDIVLDIMKYEMKTKPTKRA